jgi:hypothetical protein
VRFDTTRNSKSGDTSNPKMEKILHFPSPCARAREDAQKAAKCEFFDPKAIKPVRG